MTSVFQGYLPRIECRTELQFKPRQGVHVADARGEKLVFGRRQRILNSADLEGGRTPSI